MKRRAVALLTASAALATACGGPQLADPPEVTLPPTTTVPAPAQPECTEAERDENATRSYAPDGALPPPGEMPAGSTMAEIAERERLIVGVSADTQQFGARNPFSGAIEGFDIDILKEVARAIFVVPEGEEPPIEYRVMPYAGRLPSLESGEVDLVAHTMTINCDRWKRIGFSSTYFDAGQKVLVLAESGITGIADLVANGGRVCAPGGSTNIDEISKPEYTDPPEPQIGIVVVEKPDVTDCLVAVQQGEADAATGDDTVLVGVAVQDPNLAVVGETFTSEPYGVGVNAEQVDLTQFVNAVLEDVRTSGRWAEIWEDWVGPSSEDPAPMPPEAIYGREAT